MQFFRLIIGIAIFIFLSGSNACAQLPSFSGFWLTPQLTAPTAMAGNEAYQVTAHYRRQGSDENTGYRTMVLSGQIPLYNRRNNFGTLGVSLLRDESGDSFLFSSSGGMITYLYDAELAYRHHLVGGVQGAYYWRRIDWGNVTTSNQIVGGTIDPALSPGEEFSDDPSKAFLANVGLAYYLTDYEGDPVFHIGTSIRNANRGSFTYLINPEYQSIPTSLVSYAHIRLISNPYFEVQSDLFWRSEKKVNDLTGGFQVRKGTRPRVRVADNHIGIGLYYTQDHTGILALQLVQPNWLLGISYDLVFGNKPLGKMQNAVEVSLGWRAIRRDQDRNQNHRKYRRRLPWKNKKRLPWQ